MHTGSVYLAIFNCVFDFQSDTIVEDSSLSDSYRHCTINDFRSGSIVAYIQLKFNSNALNTDKNDLIDSVEEFLQILFHRSFSQTLLEDVSHFVQTYNPDLNQVAVLEKNDTFPPVFIFTTTVDTPPTTQLIQTIPSTITPVVNNIVTTIQDHIVTTISNDDGNNQPSTVTTTQHGITTQSDSNPANTTISPVDILDETTQNPMMTTHGDINNYNTTISSLDTQEETTQNHLVTTVQSVQTTYAIDVVETTANIPTTSEPDRDDVTTDVARNTTVILNNEQQTTEMIDNVTTDIPRDTSVASDNELQSTQQIDNEATTMLSHNTPDNDYTTVSNEQTTDNGDE